MIYAIKYRWRAVRGELTASSQSHRALFRHKLTLVYNSGSEHFIVLSDGAHHLCS